MDLKDIKIFLCICDELHFTRAARKLKLNPSALTRSIQKLEAELQSHLFIRDNRSVSLTQTGTLFREFSKSTLQQWNQILGQINENTTSTQGELSIYGSVTACHYILPNLLEHFRTAFPYIHLKIQTGDEAKALPNVLDGKTDVALAAFPDNLDSNLEFFNLMETPLAFILSNDSLIYKSEKIDWSTIPMILPESGLSRQRIDKWFKTKKVTPNIYAQVAGHEALLAMVNLGCGLGVVPKLVLQNSPFYKNIKVIPVHPSLKAYSVGLCCLKSKLKNPILKTFWDSVIHNTLEI